MNLLLDELIDIQKKEDPKYAEHKVELNFIKAIIKNNLSLDDFLLCYEPKFTKLLIKHVNFPEKQYSFIIITDSKGDPSVIDDDGCVHDPTHHFWTGFIISKFYPEKGSSLQKESEVEKLKGVKKVNPFVKWFKSIFC